MHYETRKTNLEIQNGGMMFIMTKRKEYLFDKMVDYIVDLYENLGLEDLVITLRNIGFTDEEIHNECEWIPEYAFKNNEGDVV